ncbi:reverse transcriptase domain-containing protein [Tanacetum coccineum]
MSNQTNELKNMMASFFQMNTAFSSGSGSLPGNTIANPKGKLKAITTRSGLVINGPSVPMSPLFINPEEDERAEETLTDPELAEYTLSKLKCKALADLGASINLMPLSVWKKLGLPKLISTRMTLELTNRAICTPAGIARDVFVLVEKFTFLADFIIVDYESDPRVPLILGRPFLRTARALIDVHGEEMILRDGDERLILNMRHDTSSYSNKPQKESINIIDIYNGSHKDYLEDLFSTNHLKFEAYLASDTFPLGSDDTDFDPEGDLRLTDELLKNDPSSPLLLSNNTLSGNTTSSSLDHLLEEFTDELALITFPWEMMIFLLISNPILEK